MNKQLPEIKALSAYDAKINRKLYNETITFIMETTEVKDLDSSIWRLSAGSIWFEYQGETFIPQKLGFQYLGELLERYEERAGNEIRDTRAIALALGSCRELLSDRMFVGRQKSDFVKKIAALSSADIYLQGALCLLYEGDPFGESFRNSLLKTVPESTEDVIFLLSVLPGEFHLFKPALLRLLGKERTLPVNGNIRIYAWLVQYLYSHTKGRGTKDMALFRALVSLATSFVKKESKPYQVLEAHGYDSLEITYLNYTVRWFVNGCCVGAELVQEHGIVGEKIAVEFLSSYLSAQTPVSEELLSLLDFVVKLHETLSIKCYGAEHILDAAEPLITLRCPENFAWLYKKIQNSHRSSGLFWYDVHDTEWDKLTRMLSKESYLNVYDSILLRDKGRVGGDELSDEEIRWRIDHYQKLTGEDYLAFSQGYRAGVFQLMVDRGFLTLIGYYETLRKRGQTQADYCLQCYILEWKNRKSCEFLFYLYQKYNPVEIKDITGEDFLRGLYQLHYYSSVEKPCSLTRSFLNEKENELLFTCVSDYLYCNHADRYWNFLERVLSEKEAYPFLNYRELYDTISAIDSSLLSGCEEKLLEQFMTKEELLERARLSKLREETERKEKEAAELQSLKAELSPESASLETLYKFWKNHEYHFRTQAVRITADMLDIVLSRSGYGLTVKQIVWMLEMLCDLIECGETRLAEAQSIFTKVKLEDSKNASV